MEHLTEYHLEELLEYEQPTAYIVSSTDYSDNYKTPVLTAGKSFILGYTNETAGIFDRLPVIIFDDFTTAIQYVNFPFKVKSSAMKILHINKDLVHPKYIFYRMQVIQFDHSTHKRYWIQQYSKIKVKLPSLPEQERIVARIEELFSELDKAVETLNTTKQQLAVYRQAVLKEAFDVTSDVMPLGEYIDSIEGGKSFKCIEVPPQIGECGIVKVSSVTWGEFNENESKTCDRNKFLPEKRILPGDFLFSRANTLQLVGNCVIVKHISKELMLSDKILRIKFKQQLLPQYALYFLRSKNGRQQIERLSTGNQESMRNIGQDRIRKILIPALDLCEQKRIVRAIGGRLSLCDQTEKTIEQSLQQAEALRQSILKQAFEGRL